MTRTETAALKRMQFDILREGFETGHIHDSETRKEVKANLLAQVAAAIDQELLTLREGQGLGIVFNLIVQNSDLTFRSEPAARTSPELRDWRAEVMKRDEYICKNCGGNNGLCVHHIKHWAKCPADRFNVANGVTLCVECHAKQHPENPAFILSSQRPKSSGKTNKI